uniref:Centrosomal protein of 112 kDa n=1 Tax=Zeugodacus cucurbitae TaxID=28588 RepID=A0A0A1XQF5_ZEUCU
MSYSSGIDFDFLLTEDFLLFLDLCRDPNQVFTPNSDESCLAQQWLDKLCRYDCADLDERRLRNIYMSYLCCCLIEGVLKGPFSDQPRDGRLQMVNFNAVKKQPLSCPVTCPGDLFFESHKFLPVLIQQFLSTIRRLQSERLIKGVRLPRRPAVNNSWAAVTAVTMSAPASLAAAVWTIVYIVRLCVAAHPRYASARTYNASRVRTVAA